MRVVDAVDFLGGFVMGEGRLAEYVRGASINSDERPWLEFTPAMAYFRSTQYLVENLAAFHDYRESVLPLLVNTGATEEEAATVAERVRLRTESTQHAITGDVFFILGAHDRARAEYEAALEIDPDDKNWASRVWWEGLPYRRP